MLLISSEILHVPLINAYEGVCGNRFIFPESVNIKKKVKFWFPYAPRLEHQKHRIFKTVTPNATPNQIKQM